MTQSMGLGEPKHPLVYVFEINEFKKQKSLKDEFLNDSKFAMGFYSIFLKDGDCAIQYGRNTYDFDEGMLSFFAPGQVVGGKHEGKLKYGWGLFFHPDLIRKSELGKIIDTYNFFSYGVHEALHLSKKEEDIDIQIEKEQK